MNLDRLSVLRVLRTFSIFATLAGSLGLRAAPAVGFTWPTNGQVVISLAGLAGTVQAGGSPVQSASFSIFDLGTGQYWNGAGYQPGPTNLPAALSAAGWRPAGGVGLPGVCCGRSYVLTAVVTDGAAATGTASITVRADATPPLIAFAPGSSGGTVTNFAAVTGTVTDNFNAVASVTFSIQEVDINGGNGRFWDGAAFQAAPVPLPASIAGGVWAPSSSVALPQLNSGQSYVVTAVATDTTSNSASATLTLTAPIAVLEWDLGQTPAGSAALMAPNLNGGDYWFQIVPRNPVVGVWRTALNVTSNQAGVYLSQGAPPTIYNGDFGSARPGSNGFVVDASQYEPGQTWYILVHAEAGAAWRLVTGDAYVYPLGPLAADASSGTNVIMGAEGMAFFETTVPSAVPAWRLWLGGATNMLYVKTAAAPDAVSHDLTQAGQMLVVPPYLAGGAVKGAYFIGAAGLPGTAIHLDSRQQIVTDIAFGGQAQLTVGPGDFPYLTYRVQVPVKQVAWQLNLTPSAGNPAVAVRRDLVPNEFRNDAFSETPIGVGASVALVPPPPQSNPGVPGLSDGTWYVTVYGSTSYACGFVNANPVITPEGYVFQAVNDDPNRAGWRYYVLTNITQQLGSLGWALTLSGQAAGSEVAIRRNAVPGQWTYRTADDNPSVNTAGYVDLTDSYGLLQQPGHQADIWYVGVYSPEQALGSFTLNGDLLTGRPLSVDGTNSTFTATNQPPGQWGFFQVVIPADTNLLGWDVRLVGVTEGAPQLVVCRDALPTGPQTTGAWDGAVPWASAAWPSAAQWGFGGSWAAPGQGYCGPYIPPLMAMGVGNPLQPGTYYVGVQDPNHTCRYTIESRGIGRGNYTIPVHALAFDGAVTNNALAVMEGDYYEVRIPADQPDWRLRLRAVTGDAILAVQKDYIPNSGQGGGYGDAFAHAGGQLMMKAGDEQWILLPQNNDLVSDGAALEPATFYVLVAGQGQNPVSNCLGAGSGYGEGASGYTLTSGVEPVTILPDTLAYGSDLVLTNAQAGGELKLYQFSVPAGLASVEITLENTTGYPTMFMNQGTNLVGTWWANYGPYQPYGDPYGNWGGTNFQSSFAASWMGQSRITVANPAPGPYSLSVGALGDSGQYPDAAYRLRVHAAPPPVVAFDGGTFTVTNQPAGVWGFYQITVPTDTNLLGWDVRLTGVLGGQPQLVVCRAALPDGPGTSPNWSGGGAPWEATGWSDGDQWGFAGSWAALPESYCGTYLPPILAMGIGNPLEPGVYFVGVQDPNNVCSYTLQSRGIALAGYAIPVKSLDFAGVVANPSAPVAEADYYQVQVPAGVPDWKLHLHATAGEVLLKVQKDHLPNSGQGGGYGEAYGYQGGQQMMKVGDEQWVLLPQNNDSVADGAGLEAGTFYLAVISQGENPVDDCLGPGSDLLATNAQAGGEMKFYQFDLPAGLASVQWTLENVTGNPRMYLNQGTNIVGTWWVNWGPNTAYADPYGNWGGTNFQSAEGPFWTDPSLITIANPAPGPYSLSVVASGAAGEFPDAAYRLRVHANPPPVVAFDGGMFTVTNQPAGTWGFYQITVPTDTNLLGWDVRLVDVSAGHPLIVVGRDTLPVGMANTTGWGGAAPWASTDWPSGSQWEYGGSWAAPLANYCGAYSPPLLAMGMGNPLEPGTYYVGVQDPDNACAYTITSRGIGFGRYKIPVRPLDFSGGVTNVILPVMEGDYYQVQVPPGTPDWKLQLHALTGDVLLKVEKDHLPNSGQGGGYGEAFGEAGGQEMMKPGDEQWVLLPQNNSWVSDGASLEPGLYYALVVSQGQDITNNCYGIGSGYGSGVASYALLSGVEPVTVLPDALAYGRDLLATNKQAGGEMKFYQFRVPAGLDGLELSFEGQVGRPTMYLNQGTNLVGTWWLNWGPGTGYADAYGNWGGVNFQSDFGAFWESPQRLTLPNVAPGVYSLSVVASGSSGEYPEADYVLHIRARSAPAMAVAAGAGLSGLTNVASGVLADAQSDFYRIQIPATFDGAPVLGWKLDLSATNGTPSVRVRPGLLPDDNSGDGTSPYSAVTATIAPPYLTPGEWFVQVTGNGATTYSLSSGVVTTNTLRHPLWVMPGLGESRVAPGLDLPAIGDSGVDTNGVALAGDQGVDLSQGGFDYYAVVVPSNNAALLRTELQAISGNPNLYLRVGAAPTLAHADDGRPGTIYDRSLTGSTTEYANWVPLDGRYESRLTEGLWVLAVQAGGNANARYRLQLSCGNPAAGGVVQEMALQGGSFTNQTLNGGDWRYYKLQVPDPAPAAWTVTFERTLGAATMFLRDTSPPGDGNHPSPLTYADPGYNPGPWQVGGDQDLESWAGDGKNEGPYPRFDLPGTYTIHTPPLRPGSTYYLGFWSPVDTTFSVNSITAGGVVTADAIAPFYGGAVTDVIPGLGSRLYRIDAPAFATRLVFNAVNSANLVLSLEQGAPAIPGGPAHWTSYLNGDSQLGATVNASLSQDLTLPDNWPWLPGRSYYLAVTNTSPDPEGFSLVLGIPADLSPVSLSVPTNIVAAAANPAIGVAWTVTNLGPSAAAGSWYDTVWLSTNGVLDADSIRVEEFWVQAGNLPKGSSYTVTNTVVLPLAASGPYTLFVQVDAGGALYESNLGDKLSPGVSGFFHLSPPDLAILAATAPAEVVLTQPNPVVTVIWSVLNQGLGPATGGWSDRVWFSTNGVLDAASIDLGDLAITQTVEPGAIYTQTNAVTLPVSAAGVVTLFVQANVFTQLPELAWTNNISPGVPVAVLAPLVFDSGPGSLRWTPAGLQLQLDGLFGRGVIVYASTNLSTWTPIYTNQSAAGSLQFLDPQAASYPVRFYKAVEP